MQISLNWLKEYVDIEVPVDELAHQLTMLGLEIEAISRPGEEIHDVYVGRVLAIEPHPDADKLVVCKTDTGGDTPLQIVCGASNMQEGDMVPTAVVGATLPGGFKIGRRKMRGIESQGMMCSAKELGLGEDHSGLMILPQDLPLGEDVKPLLGLDDVVFEIEVIPNRGDWASMIGVARELAALYGKPLRIPEITLPEAGPAADALSSVTIEDPEKCPRYIGRVLRNVQAGPSPQWLATRLIAAGQRPINNIVDITNYVLLETGHPLHAFDYDKLHENRIVVRCAKPGETIRTLDEEQRTLAEDMLVIADAEAPQAVAGVMGGADSEVGEGTARIFLESAYFNPVSVRRTSRKLGLMTEASQHFQRGADPEMAVYAINRAAALMHELAGAEVAEGLLDEYPNPLEVREVRLRYTQTNRLLGADIAPEFQRDALEKLAFESISQDGQGVAVRVPTWRHDVTLEADLIEEIARLYGYNNIPVTLPRVRQSEMVFAPEENVLRRLRKYLVGLGLTELLSWTFSSPEAVREAGLDGAYLDMVALDNPLSERQATMRSTLLPGLLATAAHNFNRGVFDISAFELGPAYHPAGAGELPTQTPCLGILLAGAPEPAHWSRGARQADFYDLKGLAEAVFEFFGVHEGVEWARSELALFQTAQAADIALGGTVIGHCGRVANAVRKVNDIEHPVYLAELKLEPLLARDYAIPQFEAVPPFPPSLRDMAVLVDQSVPAGALLHTAAKAGGNLLKTAEIFDIYTGEQVPAGKKSVALSLVFQSQERTLTDKDTQKSWNKILKQLEKQHGAELR